MAGFIFKVIVLSVGLAIAIKYGGPVLPVAATNSNALISVCLPALTMAIILGWRWKAKAHE